METTSLELEQTCFISEDGLTIRRTNPYKVEKVSEYVFEFRKCSKDGTPKTLVCHDMKGGYLGNCCSVSLFPCHASHCLLA